MSCYLLLTPSHKFVFVLKLLCSEMFLLQMDFKTYQSLRISTNICNMMLMEMYTKSTPEAERGQLFNLDGKHGRKTKHWIIF